MKIFFLIVLISAAIWDAFTTVYGTIWILGDGPIQIAAAVLFSALVFSFVLNTRRIFQWQQGFVNILVKLLWVVAFCFDLFTSWVGNATLLVGGSSQPSEIALLTGLTILFGAAPIFLSGMWYSSRSETSTSSEAKAN